MFKRLKLLSPDGDGGGGAGDPQAGPGAGAGGSDPQAGGNPNPTDPNPKDPKATDPQAGDDGKKEGEGDDQQPMNLGQARELRRENQTLRDRAQTAETERDQLKTQVADLQKNPPGGDEALTSQVQKLTGERDDLQTKYMALQQQTAAEKAARLAGAVYEDSVALEIKDKIEFGEDGQPKNVKELLDALRQEKPRLFHRSSADGGARGGGGNEDLKGLDRIKAAYEENDKRR